MANSFRDQLAAIAAKDKARADALVRKVVLDVGTRLVEKSPVGDAAYWTHPAPAGYTGGRFRANWQYGFGQIPGGELPDIDKSGSLSVARIMRGVTASPAAGLHYIANNLPYAQRLEEGWSRQAPHGMVALTVVEFQGIIDGAAR